MVEEEDRRMRPRPLPVTIAAILMALVSLANLPLPLLPGSEEIPAVVVYGGIVLGVVGLVAVAGLWRLRRWGRWLTVAVPRSASCTRPRG
jgi:hypothetical protein